MCSRALRNRLAACAATATMMAAGSPVQAQQDSIAAEVDSVVAELDALARAQLDSAGGLPFALAFGGGWGAMHTPCASCKTASTALQAAAGLRISRGVMLILESGAMLGSGSDAPGIDWTTLSFRIRPVTKAGFFLQAGAGRVHASREHTYTEEDTDWSSCEWTWVLVIPLPTDCATEYHKKTEFLRTSGPVALLGIGFELPLAPGKAIVPELRVMPGHAGMSGFSLAMHFGGSHPLLRGGNPR